MKRLLPLITIVAFLVAIFGCGGGGGGNNNNGGTTGTVENITLTAVFQGTQSPATLSALQPNDQVQFVLAGINSVSGNPQTVAATYTTSAPGTVALISGGGLLSAIKTSGNLSYSVTAVANGVTYTLPFVIGSPGAKVKAVVQDINGTPVAGAVFQFYDSGANLLGQATSGANGSVEANVPPTAVSFLVNVSTLAVTYFNQFAYGGVWYSATVTNCRAPLPKLTTGHVSTLPNDVDIYPFDTGNPPPPPDGCAG